MSKDICVSALRVNCSPVLTGCACLLSPSCFHLDLKYRFTAFHLSFEWLLLLLPHGKGEGRVCFRDLGWFCLCPLPLLAAVTWGHCVCEQRFVFHHADTVYWQPLTAYKLLCAAARIASALKTSFGVRRIKVKKNQPYSWKKELCTAANKASFILAYIFNLSSWNSLSPFNFWEFSLMVVLWKYNVFWQLVHYFKHCKKQFTDTWVSVRCFPGGTALPLLLVGHSVEVFFRDFLAQLKFLVFYQCGLGRPLDNVVEACVQPKFRKTQVEGWRKAVVFTEQCSDLCCHAWFIQATFRVVSSIQL